MAPNGSTIEWNGISRLGIFSCHHGKVEPKCSPPGMDDLRLATALPLNAIPFRSETVVATGFLKATTKNNNNV